MYKHDMVYFSRIRNFTWGVSDCEELVIFPPAACKKNYLLSNSIRIEPADRKMKRFLVFQEFPYRMM